MFLDPDLLRTFLAFAEGGSLARAAAIVGRSPSAVTTQMQRLEEAVGSPLLAPTGRGRMLTPAGEELVGHARRILAAHRDALLSLKGARADGRVSLGATQDFADTVLPGLIRDFARTHSRVRLDLRIGRTMELARAFEDGAIDVAITMRQSPAPDEVGVLAEPMLWLGAAEGLAAPQDELPLALLDPPCGFRTAAVAALDAAGRRYRIAATSPSLSGLRAAVRGGIAVTVRTARWLGEGIAELPPGLALPALGDAEFSLRLRPGADQPAADLAALLQDALGARNVTPR
jgi:DNA-binding transcriptional LysR family regulator